MKLVSWNVNGIRAIAKKNFFESLDEMDADVLCIQETKAQDDQSLEVLTKAMGYNVLVNSAVRKGYSGTAILSKTEPLSVQNDIGIEEHDQEGRVICAEYDNFYLVTVYVPNSGSQLVRLDYREQWDKDFLAYLKELESKKPVIVCGDFNVCHQRIDIARPDSNYNKTSGYTQREIDGMTNFIDAGFFDSFRYLHPEEVKYSWWSYRFNSRAKNIGWRLDYFLLSESLKPNLESAFIYNEHEGSDHCPVGVEIKF